MSDWWTYRLSDFLMFAPRTYYRLFERYNAEVWPAHAVALAIGVVIGVLVFKSARPDAAGGARNAAPGTDGRREALALRAWALPAACALLAGGWLWVAVMFHLRRYAEINWAAAWFGAAFALQAVLLLVVAGASLWRGGHGPVAQRPAAAAGFAASPASFVSGPAGWRGTAGLGLLLYALLVHPFVGRVFGRPWTQAEFFGLAPDPTALATLGLLLMLRPTGRVERGRQGGAGGAIAWMLWPLPVLWSLVSGATLWAMQAPDAWLMPAAALLAGGVAWRSGASE